MLVVISPAKALDCSRPKIKTHTLPQFIEESIELVRVMKKKSSADLKKLMAVSDDLAQLNHSRFQEWKIPFTLDNAKQAILTFKGDVYKSLDAESLNMNDLKFAQKHLYILSGLYGLLRVFDLIQPYRLEMGTKLSHGQWKSLYQFWGDKLSNQINESLKAHGSKGVLVNLASQEYYKVLKSKQVNVPVITPAFKEKKGNDYKTIGFVAKKARGMMSRYIIENRIKDVEQLKQFKLGGYRFRPNMSDESTWVFTRA